MSADNKVFPPTIKSFQVGGRTLERPRLAVPATPEAVGAYLASLADSLDPALQAAACRRVHPRQACKIDCRRCPNLISRQAKAHAGDNRGKRRDHTHRSPGLHAWP